MPTPFRDKYYLKTVNQDISLLDRKIAHSLRYETFATEGERTAAVAKLSTKRAQLAAIAQEMADAGIGTPDQAPVAAPDLTAAPA
jgi:hypothetical protein